MHEGLHPGGIILNEKDQHFTLSPEEVLEQSWNRDAVLRAIARRLQAGHYDFVIVLLPTEDTHGEHKAASILTLQAVQQLPVEQRPVVPGAQASGSDSGSYQPLRNYLLTATSSSQPAFRFDRDVRFGYADSLSYQIVVDWVIAEHKSQGLFQNRCRQDRFENFWIFSVSGKDAVDLTSSLFSAISQRSDAGQQTTNSKSGKTH